MQRAVLLGDSIRQGYERYVRELLEDRAEICAPRENCRFAGYMFISMPAWAREFGKPEEVSLVHWNSGHWDCAHFDDSPEPYSTVEEYAAWLERVHRAIVKHFPNAQIVFATTTLVDMTKYPAMANRRSNDEIKAYNDAALRVMNGLGVTVNDLAGLSSRFSSSYYADAVHMNEDGYRALAAQVADMIARHLDKR
jgi:Lysophospholipase L1 and related esterases